jgi:hypothetical protein
MNKQLGESHYLTKILNLREFYGKYLRGPLTHLNFYAIGQVHFGHKNPYLKSMHNLKKV